MEQARRWLAGQVHSQTLLSLALLLIIFASLVHGISHAVRGIEPALLWPIVWFGLFVGWGLAWSPLSGWWATAVGLLLGTVLTLLRVGQLGAPVLSLLGRMGRFVWQVLWGSFWPDPTPIRLAWAELGNGVDALFARLYTWLWGLARGQELFDPVALALVWSLVLWAALLWAIWAVRRRTQPMWGAIPAGALLAATLAYVGGRALYLLPILAAALVLRALVGHDTRRKGWEQTGVPYPRRIRSDTAWMAVGLTVALVILAAIIPSISVYSIVEFVRGFSQEDVSREELAGSLGLEQQSEAVPKGISILDARRSGSLPTRHLIGSGPELSEQVVMFVNIEPTRPTTATADTLAQPEPIYYWRSLTYDRYTDRGWFAEYAGRARYEAGELANPVAVPNQTLLRQHVRLVGGRSDLLYAAGTLVTADRDYQVAWRLGPSEGKPGDVFGALIDAGDYRADSLVPVVSETGFRMAGQAYPAWILERYLQLPDGVPDRVMALARDLTASERTPYDRALAIERYLRQFPYTLALPTPPADREYTDYFLFDLQKGYCDYYATAMVVLARAAGLPARLVTGYAQGTYDEAKARYAVTEADAHAWPEIYFPGYGWIEFEPTANRPAIERPAEPPPSTVLESEVPPEPITAHRIRMRWAWWLGGGAALIVLALGILVVWALLDAWRLRRMPPPAAVTRLYRRLYRYGRWLGVRSQTGDTPQEFAITVTLRLRGLADSRRWGGFVLSAVDEVSLLADLCTRALYSRHEPKPREQALAIQAWGRLRWRMWLARLIPHSGRLL